MVAIKSTNELQIRMLPTACIIDGFVGNRKDSYEDYLIEFVNASSYFQEKSKGKTYVKPESEANGECDCISPDYSLDFKLLISKSMAQGISCFTDGITELPMGMKSIGLPKIVPSDKRYKPIKGYLAQYLFRYISSDELHRLQKDDQPIRNKEGIELSKEEQLALKDFLSPLQKEKNLLLMLPYEVIRNETEDRDSLGKVCLRVACDYSSLFDYRREIHPELDTYISYVFGNDWVVFTKDSSGKCIILDRIPLSSSPKYYELRELSEWY